MENIKELNKKGWELIKKYTEVLKSADTQTHIELKSNHSPILELDKLGELTHSYLSLMGNIVSYTNDSYEAKDNYIKYYITIEISYLKTLGFHVEVKKTVREIIRDEFRLRDAKKGLFRRIFK